MSKAHIEQTLGISDGGFVTIAIRHRPIKYEGTAAVDAKKQGVEQGHIAGLGRDALLTEADGLENLTIFRGDYDFINVMVMGSIPVKPASAAVEKPGRMVLDGWK